VLIVGVTALIPILTAWLVLTWLRTTFAR
jgi:hypothetical protein